MRTYACALSCLSTLFVVGGLALAADKPTSGEENTETRISSVSVSDPAFDVYVSPELIGRAWQSLDPQLMTDVALMLVEGESILQRPREAITANEALELAIRLAAEKGDSESLDRVTEAVAERGNEQLQKQQKNAQKLASSSRDTTFRMMVPVDEMTPEEYRRLYGYTQEVLRAKLTGDTRSFEGKSHWIPDLAGDNPELEERLKKFEAESRDLAENPDLTAKTIFIKDDLRKVLDRLAFQARSSDDDDDDEDPETEIADQPVPVSGAF